MKPANPFIKKSLSVRSKYFQMKNGFVVNGAWTVTTGSYHTFDNLKLQLWDKSCSKVRIFVTAQEIIQ